MDFVSEISGNSVNLYSFRRIQFRLVLAVGRIFALMFCFFAIFNKISLIFANYTLHSSAILPTVEWH